MNYQEINMNTKDYPATHVASTPIQVMWRGVNLYKPEVLKFEAWIKWELNRSINYINPHAHTYVLFRYNGCSGLDLFPVPTTSEQTSIYRFLRSSCPWDRSWKLSLICFLQAHARKIQKWWCDKNIVAVPCAEDVEQ